VFFVFFVYFGISCVFYVFWYLMCFLRVLVSHVFFACFGISCVFTLGVFVCFIGIQCVLGNVFLTVLVSDVFFLFGVFGPLELEYEKR
jgi:hypothetical protein